MGTSYLYILDTRYLRKIKNLRKNNMTDTNKDNNKDGTDAGLSVNKDGINCLFCRWFMKY